MKRVIVQPADVSGAALAELKQWLGITRDAEDGQLLALLRTSLDLCEAFTGQMPLEATGEERTVGSNDWVELATRPVRAIVALDELASDGTRTAIPAANFAIDIAADASGRVRLVAPLATGIVVVRFVAGIATNWEALPDALRHGIIRLAAHHYLTRDGGDRSGPPASVAALWRPWQRIRLV